MMKARKAASNRQDAPARASKVASRRVASKAILEVDKTRTIWKTTISAPAMHRPADRDAAARIAKSYYSLLFCFEHGRHAPCSFFTRDVDRIYKIFQINRFYLVNPVIVSC